MSADGYSSVSIINKVSEATDKVMAGEGAFERDGVVFDAPDPPYRLIAPALSAALVNCGRLSVLDFGGSLGSLYRQIRPALLGINEIVWCVVEQDHYVLLGRQKYTNRELFFFTEHEYFSIENLPNIVFFSSVLQYLERPDIIFSLIDRKSSITDIVIDRTPFFCGENNKLVNQIVPASIYRASYPMWIFSQNWFKDLIKNNWNIFDEQMSIGAVNECTDGTTFEYRYIWLRRR
jgi:putative methyltransferase (TIGR04325 family)